LSAQLTPLAGLIPRIGRHSTKTRGGESFIQQSAPEWSAFASGITHKSRILPGDFGIPRDQSAPAKDLCRDRSAFEHNSLKT
jgi:hypothetical protein